MSMLLCRQEQARHPYYIEPLGVHLYSSQELSYVIWHYPLLVMDGFVDENLLGFLRDELNQGFLAGKIENWLKSGENPDETLVMILQEGDYYRPSEISAFRQRLGVLRSRHPAELAKMRADELFSMHQYGRALRLYQEVLEYPKDKVTDDRFQAKILNNIGSCYACMFQFKKAYDAYERACLKDSQPQILERIYGLTCLDERLVMGERLKGLVTEDMKKRWKERHERARSEAGNSAQILQLEELFKQESERRLEGEMQMVRRWKQEYRGMV